jgi:hypothetical protein
LLLLIRSACRSQHGTCEQQRAVHCLFQEVLTGQSVLHRKMQHTIYPVCLKTHSSRPLTDHVLTFQAPHVFVAPEQQVTDSI